MKKKYEKPIFVFENFSLDTTIAGACEKEVGNPTRGTCGIPGSDGSFLFSDDIDGCTFDWAGLAGDSYDGFCYHVPTDDKNLFNS